MYSYALRKARGLVAACGLVFGLGQGVGSAAVLFHDDLSSAAGYDQVDLIPTSKVNNWYRTAAVNGSSVIYHKETAGPKHLNLGGSSWALHAGNTVSNVAFSNPSLAVTLYGTNDLSQFSEVGGTYRFALLNSDSNGYVATMNIGTGAISLYEVNSGLSGSWTLLSNSSYSASSPSKESQTINFSVTGNSLSFTSGLGGSVTATASTSYDTFTTIAVGFSQDPAWNRTVFVTDVSVSGSPIPEPANAAAVLGLGCLFGVFVARKRRR